MFTESNHIESIKIIKTIYNNTIFYFKLYILNTNSELILPNIFIFKIQNDTAELSLMFDDNRKDYNNIYEKINSQSSDLSDFLYCNIIFAIEYIRHNYNCKKITTKYWSIDILNIIKTTVIFSETTSGPIHGALEIEI